MGISNINFQRILLFFIALSTSIVISAQTEPEPCGTNPAMTSTCFDACVICDIDGFTGRNNLSVQGQVFSGFCTTWHHNTSYIAFIAGTPNLTIDVTVSNCTINLGLEIGLFESLDCQTFTPVSQCDTDVEPNTTVSFSNTQPLVVGQHYYLIMDGSNGDICDWTFNVTEGSTAVGTLLSSGAIDGNEKVCPGIPSTYSTTGEVGAALFYWTVNGVTQPILDQEVDIEFPADGFYELCVTAANVCDEAPPTCTIITVETPETLFINETICDNECIEVAGEMLCQTGTYDYVIALPNGCDSMIFVDLVVLPQAEAFIDINLCVGEEFLVGTTPYSTTGVFLDTILTTAECDSIVTLDLFMIECEIIGSTDFVPPICNGEATGFLVFSVENGTPPFTYDWSNILDPTVGGVGTTSLFTNNMIANVPSGEYEINVRDDFGNDVVLFQTVTEPSALSVSTEAIDINGFNLSCNGGADGTASATGFGGVPPYSFEWDNSQSGNIITNLAAATYSVNITDSRGCIRSNTIDLLEPSPISFNVSFIDPNCDGLETGMVQLDSISGGTPPYQYAINSSTFNLTDTYQNLGPGTYEFFMVDANDCLVDTSSTLTPPDIPQLFMGDDLLVDLGCDVLIPVTTNNTNLINIQWMSLLPTLDCDTCLRPFAKPVNTSQYFLTVTSVDNCSTTDSINVVVNKVRDVFVPNIFSPNLDGVNDRLNIHANKSVVSIKDFKVFTRWGELVYQGTDLMPNDMSTGWDGNIKGEKQQGIYVWMMEVEYLDGEVILFSGDVMLVL